MVVGLLYDIIALCVFHACTISVFLSRVLISIKFDMDTLWQIRTILRVSDMIEMEIRGVSRAVRVFDPLAGSDCADG